MRYTKNYCYCSSFPHLTLVSLFVNLSAPESVVSSDGYGAGARIEHSAQPNSVLWSLEQFLTSTDRMEAFLVDGLGPASDAASLPGPNHSSSNMPAPQSDMGSWGLNRFVTHSERIDDIRLGSHNRAATKCHERTLLAQMDSILTVLQPAIHLSDRELEQGAS
jgi:hypothetical protein